MDKAFREYFMSSETSPLSMRIKEHRVRLRPHLVPVRLASQTSQMGKPRMDTGPEKKLFRMVIPKRRKPRY